ncbi:tetratricopeptide (TPR) repeat protein [Allocatelliglobosispora scoriae]|uniref:Tetratricopeptide (TPR) repeat protein n=1 Tax=Allocatelliglobosispora scoriae TaxID=643052 RepID=A0A841C6L6_9ACTN|nr:CHAT domain-containing protein [Allocatelliglobosispora scoriae]MBB5874580.1 tetratricopeptide (TPR) repeat protein [Allocatelliglobosispora scoriae]
MTDAAERDRLTAAITARLGEHRSTGDPAVIGGADAEGEAAALLGILQPLVVAGGITRLVRLRADKDLVRAVTALADLHWHRHLAGFRHQERDLHLAAALYVLVLPPFRPDLPDGLRPLVTAVMAHTGPGGWARAAWRYQKIAIGGYDGSALTTAAGVARMAVVITRPDSDTGAFARSVLGLALSMRAQTGVATPGDLAEAEAAVTESFAYFEQHSPTQAIGARVLLAHLRLLRCEQGYDPAKLDTAIELLRPLTAAGEPLYPMAWSVLGRSLALRHRLTGADADLDEAVECAARAASARDVHPIDRTTYLSNLGVHLVERYEGRQDVADLQRAVDVIRQGLAGIPAASPFRGMFLTNLTNALRLRFLELGDPGDLDEAVRAGLAAERLLPDTVKALANLADALYGRFAVRGDLADLHAAIDRHRRANELPMADGLDAASRLPNLALMLLVRFYRLGTTADLEEGIDVCKQALAIVREPRIRASALGALAEVLNARFDALADPADQERAFAASEQALRECPPAHFLLQALQLNRGARLIGRYESTGDVADLEAAIPLIEAAVHAPHLGTMARPEALGQLGHALLLRADGHGGIADRNRAVAVLRRAVDTTAEADPAWAGVASRLARALLWPDQPTGNEQQEAIELLRRAAACETAPAESRLIASRRLGRQSALAGRWEEAATAYARGVELLPRLALHGMTRIDGELALDGNLGLAMDAAACALNLGDPRRALELVEHGRAVIWRQMLSARSDLSTLRAAHPDIADELELTRRHLDEVRPDADLTTPAGVPFNADQRIALMLRWAELVARVRSLPGFGSFMAPPTAAELLAAGRDGPVAVVNVSHWRCDALVVAAGTLTVVRLPGLTHDESIERANAYLAALKAVEDTDGEPSAQAELDALLLDQLVWLWDVIAEPVLTAIGGDPGRMWWCPTGALTLLPLHGAGHHDGSGRALIDRVVCSTVPTLQALIRARSSSPGSRSGRLMFVGMPRTEGLPDLRGAAREQKWISGVVPPELLTTRVGPAATRTGVLADLAEHDHAHFSCHGIQVLGRPSLGGLMLADGMIAVTDITADHAHGELVVMSACMTATGGITVPDEAVSLAAALHHAGWRQVVATLWTVWDAVAARVTERLYSAIVVDGELVADRSAGALREAMLMVRDEAPDRPSRWVPFIHIGR